MPSFRKLTASALGLIVLTALNSNTLHAKNIMKAEVNTLTVADEEEVDIDS